MYVGTQSAALDENLTANVLNANDKNICKKIYENSMLGSWNS